MSKTIYLPGKLPGMNEIIAAAKSGSGKGNAYARMKKEWTNIVCLTVQQFIGTPMECVDIQFEWWCSSKRRDPDNIVVGRKFILDGLVQAGILKNDGWKQIKSFSDTWRRGAKDGVFITITESKGQIKEELCKK